ncbi:MAG: signal peptidase I [Fimbriimonadaceae bacterium]|nr:signal peptidase I [Fimbriimonadaceae bacterium]
MDLKTLWGHRLTHLAAIASIAGSAYLLQPYRPVVIVGESMSPTYRNKEIAIGSTDRSHLKVGDVVVIEGPNGTIVKRIAFMPGDWVDRFYFATYWHYDFGGRVRQLKMANLVPWLRARVPEGYVFVLGDNEAVSTDSRNFGVLPVSSIRAVLVDSKPKLTDPVR